MTRRTPEHRLADSGTLLATTHRLDGGLRVRLRLTRPSDALRVRGFLERLSPETRQRRFLSPMPRVSEAAVDHFTFYDPRERLVIAATAPGEGGDTIDIARVAAQPLLRQPRQLPGMDTAPSRVTDEEFERRTTGEPVAFLVGWVDTDGTGNYDVYVMRSDGSDLRRRTRTGPRRPCPRGPGS